MILRLVLGDQLNEKHSWFHAIDPNVIYLFQEIRSETDYVVHHIQKVVAIFLGMRTLAEKLKKNGHQIHYLRISDPENQHSFFTNVQKILDRYSITHIEYQEPDEYRVDEHLSSLNILGLGIQKVSTEHF